MEWFFTADKRKRVRSIAVPPGREFMVERIGTISIVVINHGVFSTAHLKFHGPHAMSAIAKIRRATHAEYMQRANELDEAKREVARLSALINNPHTENFLEAVRCEAAHQRERWGAEHDAGKADSDWFWLIGYVAGKALHKPQKQLHHIITTAAVCLNWHMARTVGNIMRPGIAEPSEGGK
jgi:hypothetical protein